MEKRKKILFMSSWYPVPENPMHGIFVKRHAEAVSLVNDVCVLYAAGSDKPASQSTSISSPAFREDLFFYDRRNKTLRKKYKILKETYAEGFEKILKEWGRPDIIHLNVIYPAGIFASQLCRQHRIPLVITEHWTGYLPQDGSYKGLLMKFFTRRIVARAAAICPVTGHLAANMKRLGLKGNYFRIPNVVDTGLFSLSPRQSEGKTVFLHVSSFDQRQKNPYRILSAFSAFSKDHPDARLIMAGDGENISELEVHADNIGISREKIEFHFRPVGKELVRLFHSADALILNSTYENLPVVILEAMSCGLPVISSDVGGIREYFSDENGLLFQDISGKGLQEAMGKFEAQKHKYEKEKIRSFAISNFSKEEIAKKFDSVYNLILK